MAPEAIVLELGKPLRVDVLASAIEPDGQMLAVSIVSTTCPARIAAAVDPTQTISVLASAVAPSCQIRFRVDDGAGGTADANINVMVDPKAIFYDGFELGNTAAWDDVVQ